MTTTHDPIQELWLGGLTIDGQFVPTIYMASMDVEQIPEGWQICVLTSLGRRFLIPSPPFPTIEAAVEFQVEVAGVLMEHQTGVPDGDAWADHFDLN